MNRPKVNKLKAYEISMSIKCYRKMIVRNPEGVTYSNPGC